jgi:hypothetical protein
MEHEGSLSCSKQSAIVSCSVLYIMYLLQIKW